LLADGQEYYYALEKRIAKARDLYDFSGQVRSFSSFTLVIVYSLV
jgi:hypothetical protein